MHIYLIYYLLYIYIYMHRRTEVKKIPHAFCGSKRKKKEQ